MRTRTQCLAVAALAGLLATVLAPGASWPHAAALSDVAKQKLDESFELCLKKKKGPYTSNYCVCRDGQRKPVWVDGRIVSPCGGNPRFCSAFREPWAEALAEERVYIGNLFARDLFLWDEFPDPHDLVRGYVLEKFLIETQPEHKLAEMRAYGGLAGAEFEARDAPRFFERYLALDDFDEPRHYLLAYELQRRFFVRGDQASIAKARNLASAIQRQKADFKPLRDQVHNQISAAQIPRIEEYRDGLAPGALRDRVDELVAEMVALTSLDHSALRAQIPDIEDAGVRAALEQRMPRQGADALVGIAALADAMRFARQTVEAKQVSPADRRRLVDLAIAAAAVIQQLGTAVLDSNEDLTARQHVELLVSLANAAYGGGLLMERERDAAETTLRAILEGPAPMRQHLQEKLAVAARLVEWAQRTTLYAFEEVRPAWAYLIPATALLPDDVLRGSPLMVYARVLERLETYAAGDDPIRHDIFGRSLERDVRALNPGLAFGELRVAPQGDYSREQVLALPETPADLEPAAGIFTRGEGNVVSHVQLLARALGIPNSVLGPGPYELFGPEDGETVFYVATPGGRVVVKTEAQMNDQDRAALAEFTGNERREAAGGLGRGGANKLHIEVERLDVESAGIIDLAAIRRKDSGVRGGPKAAYLGELKHHFPDKVARGIVVPFGAYYAHYRAAGVATPPELAGKGIAVAGEPLEDFVKQTYAIFFDQMMTGGASEQELADWIKPRLAIMRHSIVAAPLSAGLREEMRAGLESQGLLDPDDPTQTVGLFVRSDTNVEDLENFNGAGLNLTLFNRHSLDDVYTGLKEVWASPFTYRSFSWRQTLIDDPLWVLPSVVILESVPTVKSGVLVTADLDGTDPEKMLIATSEGVGGAVDGSPAETLEWSRDGVELVTMFKSPWRQLLRREGGSEVVPSTGSEQVLSPAEVEELVTTAARIRDEFEPTRTAEGVERPWDVEFGFVDGRLWLFQVRPFIGNESVKNMPVLAAYEVPTSGAKDEVSLDAVISR